MKKLFYLIFTIFIFSCNNNYKKIIFSPDNKIQVFISTKNNELTYSIKKDERSVIKTSKLGIVLKDNIDLTKKFKIISFNSKTHSEKWYPKIREFKEILNEYNEAILEIESENKKLFLELRLFNDGVAFRYKIPNQKIIKKYDVIDEITEFNLSENDSAWWNPAFSYRRYEFLFANTKIDDISKKNYSKLVEDISYDSIGIDAAQTPLTIKKNNGLFLSIHEAKLVDYSSMTLAPRGKGKLECELYPWSDGVKVKLKDKVTTPWRTIQIANSSSELLKSNIILNLNDDPDEKIDYSWVNTGKYMGVWWEMIGTNESTWWPSKYHGANNKKIEKYIDFASENGFDGLLVEGWNEGWYPEWCCKGDGIPFSFTKSLNDFDFEKLSRYSSQKNISIVGHHETGGQIQNYENQLEEAFKLYQMMGVKYIKTGYVNDVSKNIKRIDVNGNIQREWHHGQYMINHFKKVISLAAKYQLCIITHEPIKDTGLRRTYPNYISREGAKGQEFNGFSSNGVNHILDLPFTRLLSGPMDYTPGIFQLNNFRYTQPGSGVIDKNAIVPSTIAKELSLYVIIYSPMQMAADLPKHYKKHMEAFEFIKNVPVNWDNKIILNSKISEYLTIARKDSKSENWYVGGITNERPREFELDFSFLDSNFEYIAKIYSDTKDTHWKNNPMEYKISSKIINNKSKFNIFLAPGGGFAIEIVKK